MNERNLQLDVQTLLNRIIIAGEDAVRGRGMSQVEKISPRQELAIETMRHYKMPCEGERFVHWHTTVFIEAVREIDLALASRDDARELVARQIAGMLLPVVRQDYGASLIHRNKVASA